MKVLGLAADNGGCGFYRLRAPAEELRLLGVDIEIADDGAVDADITMKKDGSMQINEIFTDADLIVVQRPLSSTYYSLIEQAQRQGIATVVEIDDDFSTVHRHNIAHDSMHENEKFGPQWVEKSTEIADHVTVSTPQLTKYARHGRNSILRNCVPQSIFSVTPKVAPLHPRLGWTGSVQTHPDDLQQTKGAVAKVLKSNNLLFNVVGDGQFVRTNLGIDKDVEVYATGWTQDINLYYQAVHDFIDIGITPLELSPFNQAKSALKGLEYAALGIPFVASPTREYERLEAYGIGKTAKTPAEWRKHLQRMIDRSSETERIAKESRDRMEAMFTYKVTAPEWIEAWEKAITYRKTQS
jgi:glycosyltransferase involved in cell wall biosynthesis